MSLFLRLFVFYLLTVRLIYASTLSFDGGVYVSNASDYQVGSAAFNNVLKPIIERGLSPVALTNMGGGEEYVLFNQTSDGGYVSRFDLNSGQYSKDAYFREWAGLDVYEEWMDYQPFAEEVVHSGPFYDLSNAFGNNYGCLLSTPLRYAEIGDGGRKELVLLLGSNGDGGIGHSWLDFVVYSVDYRKIIFRAILARIDSVLYDDELIADFDVTSANVDSQYISQTGLENVVYVIEKGYKSFSKIFVSDLDNDGNVDVLLWRKNFISRLKSDPVLGFGLVSNQYVHYEYDKDEFKKLNTSSETIIDWLKSNGMSWQKGYPARNECSVMSGKVIPEMHDILLNDPDVLK